MNIETKQKVMISFIIIALAILVWQVMLLEKNNTTDSNRSAPPPTMAAMTNTSSVINKSQPFPAATAAVTSADNQVANSLSATTTAQSTNTAGIPQTSNTVQSSNVSGANVDPAVAANQQQYLQLVTEYQMVQIQRMIAEDEEAIAIAKSNAAKAVASTVQLAGGSPSTVSSVIPAATDSNDYELIFTGQQGDQWTATVKKDGQLYDIVVGTKLPDDSQVMAIDDNGVLLSQGDTKKLITFSGVSLIGAQSATNPHSDLSGVSANNEINGNGNVNNSNSYADNSSESDQAGLVQNSNVTKLTDQNDNQANDVVSNSTASNNNLPNNNATNVYAQNAATSVQENGVANSNTSAVNGQNSAGAVHHNSSAKPNIEITSNATSINNAATVVQNVPVIKKAPINTVANIPVIKKALTNNAATIPAAVPVIQKTSSSLLAVNTLPASSKKQEIRSITTVAQLPATVVQTKSFNTLSQEIPAQIAKANSADYTIQLIADDHMEPLNNYVRENNLQNKAVSLLTHRWGKDWYILVYGQYKSVAEANAAIRQLPRIALLWGPFVRRIGDVQNIVNNAVNHHGMAGADYANGTS